MDIIIEAESGYVLNEVENGPDTRLYAVAVRAAKDEAAVPDHLVRSGEHLGFVRLEELEPTISTKFQQGQLVGKEQERVRIAQALNEELSSGLLAAVFKIQSVKEKLQTIGSPEAQQATEASEILSETIDKLTEVLGEEKTDHGPDSRGG